MSKKKKKQKQKAIATDVAESSTNPINVVSFCKDLLNEPVAILLGVLLIFRPWRDGITFPALNIYGTFLILIASCFFLYTLVKKNLILNHKTPLIILASFITIGFLTQFTSVNYDASHRALIQQIAYGLLFLLASNALRTRNAIGLVLGALVMSALINVLWAVIHANYVLPHVRESIANSPETLQYYFQSNVLTPELKHRLEMGRAFGTFLFPNALGGFIALCLPYVLGELLGGLKKFTLVLKKEDIQSTEPLYKSILIGVIATLCMSAYVYLMNRHLASQTSGGIILISGTGRMLYYYLAFPVIVGIFSVYIIRLKGTREYFTIIQILGLCFLVPLLSYGLWITFSRGAWLGVSVSLLIAFCLVFSRLGKINPLANYWMRVVSMLFVCILWTLPALSALALEDDGFLMPNPGLDWRTEEIVHDASELSTTGETVGVDDVTSTTSLSYRMTYWRVSLLMARAHWFSGVGLGNFGTMYGHHQFLDAYDVKMAHNDYLQTFVETGLLGGILFLAFWLYFVVWGGARILHESNHSRRIVLSGMYAGILAFLVQSFFDFNFMNPSLATFAYVLAGLFYARAHLYSDSEVTSPSAQNRMPICLLLVVVLFTSYASIQQFRYDYGRTAGDVKMRLSQLGNERRVRLKLEVTKYLLSPEVQQYKPAQQGTLAITEWVPRQTVGMLRELIPYDRHIKLLGPVRRPLPDGSGDTRPLETHESFLDDDYVFIIHPDAARTAAHKFSNENLDAFEVLDKNYPHGSFLCDLSSDWLHILVRDAIETKEQLLYAEKLLKWSEKRAERNPYDPSSLVDLSRAYFERGRIDQTMKQLDYYRKGIETYRKATVLYPTAHDLQQNYGDSMTNMGNAFVKVGLTDEGNRYLLEGQEAYNRARWLARYKQDILNLR